MEDEDKTKVELIKELKALRKAGGGGGSMNHLTKRKQAEEKLTETKEYLENLIKYANAPIIVWDTSLSITLFNRAFENLSGYQASEVMGKKIDILFPEDNIESTLEHIQKTASGERWESVEIKIQRKDGELMIALWNTANILDKEKKNIIATIAQGQDITERKQAEESLRRERQQFYSILEVMPMMVCLLTPDYHIPFANRAFREKFGESKGRHCYEYCFGKKEPCDFCESYEVLKTGKPHRWEVTSPDGATVIDVYDFPFTDVDGSPMILEVNVDIAEHKQAEGKLKKTMDATIETMSKIIEAKDPYTSGHQQRVSQLATAIAKELNFSEDKVEGIRVASLIHDIGKIGLPTEILSKPGKLSDIESNLIREHSQIGYDILKSNDFSHPVANIILQHHERLNGSGYPNHLKGDEILLEAKIIGIADVVEAMSSHRPYRPALGIDAALEEISQNRGILYDSEVVDACLKLFKEKGFRFE